MGIKRSEETKKKISETLKRKGIKPPSSKGVKLTDKHKENLRISIARRGGPWNKGLRGKYSVNKGKCHPRWNGGIKYHFGYRLIYAPNDLTCIRTDGYVLEHRLVMAKYLGRPLLKEEIVHHINQDKLDNRIENLQLIQEMQHNQITKMETRIKKLWCKS